MDKLQDNWKVAMSSADIPEDVFPSISEQGTVEGKKIFCIEANGTPEIASGYITLRQKQKLIINLRDPYIGAAETS